MDEGVQHDTSQNLSEKVQGEVHDGDKVTNTMDEGVQHDTSQNLSVKVEVQDGDKARILLSTPDNIRIKKPTENHNSFPQVKEENDYTYNNESDGHHEQQDFNAAHLAPDIPGTSYDISPTGLGMSPGKEDHLSIDIGHTDPAVDHMDQSSQEMSHSSSNKLCFEVSPSNSTASQNTVIPLESSSHTLCENRDCFALDYAHSCFNQSCQSISSSSKPSNVINVPNNSTQNPKKNVTEESQHDKTHELISPIGKIIEPNKLKIGLKPAKTVSENVTKKEFLPAKIVLEDWSIKLVKSTCYCQSCKILFPAENSLNTHKMTGHSNLVALDKNVAVKSTSKVNINTDSSEYDSDDDSEIESSDEVANIVNDISKQVNSSPKINRKCKSILRDADYIENISSSKSIQKDPNSVKNFNEIVTGSICDHCNNSFDNYTSLIKHLFSVLPQMFGCDDCQLKFNDEQQYVDHQKVVHLSEQVQHYKCTICHFEVDTYYKMTNHIRSKHTEWKHSPASKYKTILVNIDKSLGSKIIANQDVTNINSSKSIHRVPKGVDDFNKIVLGRHCNHCNKTFDNHTSLIKHLYSLLVQRFHCEDCQLSFDDKQRYLNHKKTVHLKGHVKMYKCTLCQIFFNTYPKAKYHKNSRHKSVPKFNFILETIKININKNNILDDEIVTLMKKNEIQSLPHTTEKDNNVVNRHIDNNIEEQNQLKKEIKTTEEFDILSEVNNNIEYCYSKTLKIKNPPIPIGILYKCNKCDLHFLNAYHQSEKCTGTNEFVKCEKCRRKFINIDIELHKLQHFVSKSFKVHLTLSKLHARVLCRCPKCNICYKELAYWQHLMKGCEKEFIYCKVCSLKISDKNTYKIHLRYHSENSKIKLVVVDYFDPMQSKMVGKVTEDTLYKFIYCETCNTCAKGEYGHPILCENLSKILCLDCGLYFTGKAWRRHKKLHKEKSLNLHNFLFFSRTKRKYIQPPLQTFNYCATCCSHYIGGRVPHNCFFSRNTCNICLKDFDSDLSYKLHVEFHKYRLKVDCVVLGKRINKLTTKKTIPEKSINYQYIYQCTKCLEHTRSYNLAIQHAQRHIVNKTSTQRLYCKKCEKYFDAFLFKSHDHNFQYYKVLRFDYLNLFNENWFDLFEGLDKVEVETILGKSLYKDTRCVNVKLMKKGDPKFTVYVCQLCNLVVDKDSLVEHVCDSLNCWADSKYKCSTCNIYFFSTTTMEAHEKLHTDGSTKKDFRIISINNKTFINRLLSRVREKSVLVLYKCKSCQICLEDDAKLKLHNCATDVSCHFCNLCKQFLQQDNQKHHENKHKDNVEYNVVIEYFEPSETPSPENINDEVNYANSVKNSQADGKISESEENFQINNEVSQNTNKHARFDELSRLNKIESSRNKIPRSCKNKISYVDTPEFINDDENAEESDQIFKPDYKASRREETSQLGNKVKNSRTDDPRFLFYKCENCKVCIEGKTKIISHTCHIEYYKRFCGICKQYFSYITYKKHLKKHEVIKMANVVIKYFQPETVIYSDLSLQKKHKQELDRSYARAAKRKMSVENEKTNKLLCSDDEVTQTNEDSRSLDKVNQNDSPQRKIRKLNVDDNDPQANVNHSDTTQIQTQIESSEVQLSHTPYIVYVCSQCNVHLLSKKSWKTHRENHSNNIRGLGSCKHCRLTFSSKSLKRHLEFHKGERTPIRIIDLSNNTATIYDWTNRVSQATEIIDSHSGVAVGGEGSYSQDDSVINAKESVCGADLVADEKESTNSIVSNKLIIGSKPPKTVTKKEFLSVMVVLEDWSSILAKSTCYCRCCEILFPAENSYDAHKMIVHSNLVALDRNVAVKSTSKVNINRESSEYDSDDDSETKSSDETTDIIRKSKHILRDEDYLKNSSSKIIRKDRNSVDNSNEMVTCSNCNHCNKSFDNTTSLIKHLYSLLPQMFGCDDCKMRFDDELQYFDHQKVAHLSEQVEQYKCIICHLVFDSYTRTTYHIKSKHIKWQHDPASKIKTILVNINKSNSSGNKIITNQDATKEVYQSPKKSKFLENINSSTIFQRVPNNLNYRNEMVTGNYCNHCNKKFDNHTALIKHLYSLLVQSFHCEDCQVSFDDKQQYLNHKKTVHLKGHIKMYKCALCQLLFNTYGKAAYHKKSRHMETKFNRVMFAISININKNNILDNDAANSHNDNNIVAQNHTVKEINNTEDDTVSVINNNMEYCYMESITVKNPPIPIGIIFKCNKCDLHFLSVMNAYHHSEKCTGIKGFVKCEKCSRTFQNIDIELHKLQHLVSKSFKVHLIRSNLHFRVLCRCPKCNICYKELAYWQHLKTGCEKEFIHCKVCILKINDKHAYRIHLRYHSEDSKMKLIVVDYSDPTQKKIVEKVNEDIKYKLIYCETCNTCTHVDNGHPISCENIIKFHCFDCGLYFPAKTMVSHKKMHKEKSLNLHNFLLFSRRQQMYIQPPVQNFNYCAKCCAHYMGGKIKHNCFLNRHTCNICLKDFDGDASYKLHVEFHKYRLKVDSVVLGKTTKPRPTRRDKLAVPDKLNDLDKEVIPEESINNHFVYKCIKCLEHTRYYDKAIQHAQQHIVNKKISRGLYCKKCEKYFDARLFKTHDHNFQYYKVLRFDYLNLFNENWFDMFEGLDKVEVEKILGKSLYKDTRSVNVKLMKKGDPKLTIYVCLLCNLVVDKDSLVKHFCESVNSWADSKFKCNTCNIYFSSTDTMEVHEKLHNNDATIDDFRIISINYKTFINRLLSRVREKSILVLYKCKSCQICLEDDAKLRLHNCAVGVKSKRFCTLCKQSFQQQNQKNHQNKHKGNIQFNIVIEHFKPGKIRHMNVSTPENVNEDENSANSVENFQTDGKFSGSDEHSQINNVSQDSRFDDHSQSNKIEDLILYKCKNCNTCHENQSKIKKHTCHIEYYKRFCDVCKEYFSYIYYTRHVKKHKDNTYANVIIRRFQPKTVIYSDLSLHRKHKLEFDRSCAKAIKRKQYNDDEISQTKEDSQSFDNLSQMDSSQRKIRKLSDSDSQTNVDHSDNTQIQTQIELKKDQFSHSYYAVYVCIQCNVHLLTKKSWEIHRKNHLNNIKVLASCIHCRLTFLSKSLKRHLKFHKGERTPIRIIDLSNNTATIYDWTNRVSQATEIIDSHSRVAVGGEDSYSQDGSCSKLETESRDVLDLTASSEETVVNCFNTNNTDLVYSEFQNQNEVPVVKIEYTIKLFSCSQCNVYFVEEDSYKNHVNNHVALVDKDYIQCKLCLLQFLIMELHLHMANHHDTEFDFEKVLVEEHSPENKRKSLYQLMYKLQNHAVTTTCTECDYTLINL